MNNTASRIIRSEEITIDMRICTILAGGKKPGEVYFAAIAPDMELTVITLDEVPDILPCFDESDVSINLPDTSLLLTYNPAQVLKLAGKRYLTGPVILVRTNMDSDFISLTIDDVYRFQKFLASHSVTLMADNHKLPCIAKLIVTEKPSVAISYAKILGVHGRQDGYLEGNGYLVSWCVGHLVELAPPSAYGEQYVKWNIADLPILPEKWQYLVSASTKKQFGILKKLMHRADVNTVVNSCDAGREGELIFRLVYEQAGCKKPVSRLWLSSMEDSAVRAGFANLKPSTEYDALYLPIGSVINMDDRKFRVDSVDFDKDKVSLQDMALADARMPIFREEPLTVVRELYEQQDEALDTAPEKTPDYNVGDSVVVDLPTRTIEGTIGYVGETDVRIDTSAQGYSWSNEVLNKQQFEDGLRQDEPELSDEELDKLPTSVEVNGEWQTFPDAAAADKALNAEPVPEAAGNFHITDDHLGEGGAKQKYARNVEAIRTLFQLEQEHRGATAEEQQILSQYVGWGGLPDVFDPDKGNWAKEYSELKGLLSEDEYAAARSSVLNAHYTSPTVIRAIYDAVEKMGFRNGNILEPSMGIGNFFGMLPDTMQDSRLYGVELDSVTGRIAQKLYPDANIKVAGCSC